MVFFGVIFLFTFILLVIKVRRDDNKNESNV
jgi:hypothetical protein